MSSSLQWTFLPVTAFAAVASDWDGLNRNAKNLPILDAAFFARLMAHFAPKPGAVIAVLREAGAVRCAGIFEPGRGRTWQMYQPGQAPLGAWVNATDLAIEPALSRLFEARGARLSLGIGVSQIDPELLPRPATNGGLATLDYIETALMNVSGSFDDYWGARGKNLRTNVRRQQSRFERDGIVTRLVELTDSKGTGAGVDEYGRMESSGWKGAEGSALHPDNEQGRFYRSLFEDYATRGEAVVYQYLYGDRVVASDLCLARNGILIILKTTYDEAQRNTSPAALMHHDVLKATFDERRYRRIEFYGRLMEWHGRLTEDKKTLYHLNYFRFPWLAKLVGARRG
jgi:CelD/BcsL family acetyltransferase involved in cellulose biosynthesis